jgi:prolipoprotein diacylglyceryltransferase
LYLVLLSIERLGVEGFRGNPVVAWGMSEAQIIALALIVFGSFLLLKGVQKREVIG